MGVRVLIEWLAAERVQEGYTALIWATYHGIVDTVQLLLDAHADLEIINKVQNILQLPSVLLSTQQYAALQ